ncbi:MAG: DUF3489 domain-containing protein [Phenylobacterium sp.]|nr:MAG: DUF3489 domain-containing protein [Phenylobacterium sp.]
MTKLTKAQSDLLGEAAKAEDGAVEAAETAAATAKALIRRGLMISVPKAAGPSRLTITEAGRTTIGEPAVPEGPKARGRKAPGAVTPAAPPKGKIGTIIELLRRTEGASVEAMMQATGWQAHSVRGAISGAIKKDRKLAVTSEKTDAGRIYRIVEGAGA